MTLCIPTQHKVVLFICQVEGLFCFRRKPKVGSSGLTAQIRFGPCLVLWFELRVGAEKCSGSLLHEPGQVMQDEAGSDLLSLHIQGDLLVGGLWLTIS